MEQVKTVLGLAYKFNHAYLGKKENGIHISIFFIIYGLLLGAFGFVTLFLVLSNIKPLMLSSFVILPLGILLFAWGFIKLLYTIDLAAISFIKNGICGKKLSEYAENLKSKEGDFLVYFIFCTALLILCFMPAILSMTEWFMILGKTLDVDYLNKLTNNSIMYSLVASVVLSPVFSFALPSYLFKKENENYFSLILNCYTKLNTAGIIFSAIIALMLVASLLIPVFSIGIAIVALALSAANTFWYYSRMDK